MKTINSRPSAFAHLPKHGHNLSQDFMFTSPVGYLLPVLYDFLYPSEKVDVSFHLQSLTNPLAKPAMTSINQTIDVFFVPLQKLHTIAPQLLENVDDINTTFVTSTQAKALTPMPKVDLSLLSDALLADEGLFTPDESGWYLFKRLGGDYLGSCRLLDHLGLNPDIFAKNSSQWVNADDYQPLINPMFLLAYQACYYDYYRLSNFDQNQPSAYNVDFSDLHPFDYTDVVKMCALHKRPYKRDYFKNIEPSPLQTSLGVLKDPVSLGQLNINDWLNQMGYQVTDDQDNQNSGVNTQVSTEDKTFSTVSLRTAFAFEKFLRVTQRAGKHYDDQVAAHFGFKVPKGISNEVYYLGTYSNDIVFGTVVSSAETDSGALGQLAGRGYSSSKKKNRPIKFTAPCHGVLIAIYSSEPNLFYHTGIDKLHTMHDLFDYYQPEFDKLGMQPLFGYELQAYEGNAGVRLGWQFRYAQSKQKYDRCTYAFTARKHGFIRNNDSFWSYGEGAYSAYCISDSVTAVSLSSSSSYRSRLYVNPTDTDQIFLVGFDPLSYLDFDTDYRQWEDSEDYQDALRIGLSRMYNTDPFIHHLSTRYFKVSPMSTFGEPDL